MDWIKESRKLFGGYDPDDAWAHALQGDLPGMDRSKPLDERERFASNYLATKAGRPSWMTSIGNALAMPDLFASKEDAIRRKTAGFEGQRKAKE